MCLCMCDGVVTCSAATVSVALTCSVMYLPRSRNHVLGNRGPIAIGL
jgi:hypothetical protein